MQNSFLNFFELKFEKYLLLYLITSFCKINNFFCTKISSKIIRNAIKIIGLHNYSPKYLKDAMNLVKQLKNKYPFKKIVGPNFDFSVQGVENAFKSLDSKKSLRPSIIPS